MSDSRSTPDHDDFRELAAGYALHALEPADEQHFERHLTSCARCQAEVRLARETAADLAFAVSAAPPAGLREAVLDAAGTAARGPASSDARRRLTPIWVLSTAASVVLIALLGWNFTLRGDVRDARSELANASEVLECGSEVGCRPVWLDSPDSPALAVALVRGSDVRLVTRALPLNDRKRETYVLWERRPDGSVTPVAAFDVGAQLTVPVARAALAGPTNGLVSLAISLEPGRRAPTAPSRVLLATRAPGSSAS